MTQFIDAEHAGDMMNCHSHMGIIIYLCRSPIIWYSKNNNTVESSTLGLEIVAMPTGMDLMKGLRYKIRMMGIPIDRPTSVFCNNKSVVISTYVPTSTFTKNNLGICYHAAREKSAAGIHWIAHING